MIQSGGTLLRAISMGRGGGVIMGGGGMGMGGGGMGMDGSITGVGFIDSALNWIIGLPSWLSALIFTLVIVLLAYIAGKIIGKIYISIRYPNPDKPQYLTPIQKVIVLVVGVALIAGLMGSFMKSDKPDGDMMDPDFEGIIDPNMLDPGAMGPGFEGEPGGEMEGEPEGEAEGDSDLDPEAGPAGDAAANPGADNPVVGPVLPPATREVKPMIAG